MSLNLRKPSYRIVYNSNKIVLYQCNFRIKFFIKRDLKFSVHTEFLSPEFTAVAGDETVAI